ncbi:hypothetical protein [Enterococcus faecium]|uniref:hypothetical protein n=1 Tax=Enterococcus TaxID=1350 RepID=UPI00223BCA44|nr:hypothetical protein [Enterococcus faecium]MCS8593060.1 hypothetical protein [Enterococcus faecium]
MLTKHFKYIRKVSRKHFNDVKKAIERKDYYWLDRVNVVHNELILIFCIVFSSFYMCGKFLSIRNSISDTITISSIILGVIGVLIGLLISMKEDSTFFVNAAKVGKDDFFYKSLMLKLRNAFLTNLFFVVLTLMLNLILPAVSFLLKSTFLIFWSYLFLKTLWQVMYLIILITKIITYEPPKENKLRKKS